MGQVVQLKPKRVTGQRPPILERAHYHCKQCEANRFVLLEDGGVECSGCGCHVANLYVRRLW